MERALTVVGLHLELALVVLDVASNLLGFVASDGADNGILLAFEAVTEAAKCQHRPLVIENRIATNPSA